MFLPESARVAGGRDVDRVVALEAQGHDVGPVLDRDRLLAVLVGGGDVVAETRPDDLRVVVGVVRVGGLDLAVVVGAVLAEAPGDYGAGGE